MRLPLLLFLASTGSASPILTSFERHLVKDDHVDIDKNHKLHELLNEAAPKQYEADPEHAGKEEVGDVERARK